jgi:hypothetical protein
MSNPVLVNYYLLCSVRLGGKAHLFNELAAADLARVLTEKEIGTYLRKHDGRYIVHETIVGGNQGPAMVI